jgi:hypothetical protein
MDNPARKRKKVAMKSGDELAVAASPKPANPIGFFGTPPQAPVQITLDQTAVLLISALIHELKTQNDINLFKLKMMAEQEEAEINAEEQRQQEDAKQFEEHGRNMYS